MNWLAHLFLSEASTSFRIGNVLPDLVSPVELQMLPTIFLPGIERHRLIDSFTDSHAVVSRSRRRIEPAYRHLGGIITDIFYDHFLATDWELYCEIPLSDFAREVYASFEAHRSEIPAKAFAWLQEMGEQDWLCSYRHLTGVGAALNRVGSRFRRPLELEDAVAVLKSENEVFHADFGEFFPALIAHVGKRGP